MKRQNFKKRNVRKSDNGPNKIVSVPFSSVVLQAFAASGTAVALDLEANANTWATRIPLISIEYEFFRYKHVKVEIYPFTDTAVDQLFLLSYIPALAGVAATVTFVSAGERMPCNFMNELCTVPRKLILPHSLLNSNPDRWFPCSAAATLVEHVQGHIYLTPRLTSTTTITLHITGVIEFKNPAVSSLDLKSDMRLSIKEKERTIEELTDLVSRLTVPGASGNTRLKE